MFDSRFSGCNILLLFIFIMFKRYLCASNVTVRIEIENCEISIIRIVL